MCNIPRYIWSFSCAASLWDWSHACPGVFNACSGKLSNTDNWALFEWKYSSRPGQLLFEAACSQHAGHILGAYACNGWKWDLRKSAKWNGKDVLHCSQIISWHLRAIRSCLEAKQVDLEEQICAANFSYPVGVSINLGYRSSVSIFTNQNCILIDLVHGRYISIYQKFLIGMLI